MPSTQCQSAFFSGVSRACLCLALALACTLPACRTKGDDDPPPSNAAGLNVAIGFWPQVRVECAANQGNLPLLHLFLTVGSADTVRIDAMTFHASGTMTEDLDVSGLVLALDANNDGEYQVGIDLPVSGSSGTFDGDDGSFTFTMSRPMAANGSESWILAGYLSGLATTGTHTSVFVDPQFDVAVTDTSTGTPMACTGLLVTGAHVTVPSSLPTWTQIAPSGTPPTRYGHTAVHDSLNDRLVVYGGTNGVTSYGDTFALSLGASTEAWSLVSPTGGPPLGRNQHCAFYDTTGHRMFLFGGTNASNVFSDLWELDLTASSETWSQPTQTGTPPSARYGVLCAFLGGTNRAIFSGGNNGGATNPHLSDMVELDLAGANPAWTHLHATQTTGYSQSGHSGAPNGLGTVLYQFGGLRNPQTYTNGFYSVGLTSAPPPVTQVATSGPPPPAAWSAAGWDTATNRLFVFGGYDAGRGVTSGTLWAYDPAVSSTDNWTHVMTTGSAPVARCYHTLTAVPSRSSFLLLGGATKSGSNWIPRSDLWELK